MKTLTTDDLSIVTGGKNLGGTTASSSSSSGNNDQLLSAIQGIQSSLKDLGKNQNQGLFGGQNGLLFMTMALAFSRRSEVSVCAGRGCHKSGFSFRTW